MSSYRICRYKKSFVSRRQMENPGEAETKLRGEAENLQGGNDGASQHWGPGEQTPRREGVILCLEHWATCASCPRMSRGWNSFSGWSDCFSKAVRGMQCGHWGDGKEMGRKKKDGEKIPQDVTTIGRSVGWAVFLFSIFSFLWCGYLFNATAWKGNKGSALYLADLEGKRLFQARLRIVGGVAGRSENRGAWGGVLGTEYSCCSLLGGWGAMWRPSQGSYGRGGSTGQRGSAVHALYGLVQVPSPSKPQFSLLE